MMMALALPVMAQKKVWDAKIVLPASNNTVGAITVEQLTADSKGNAMLRLALKKSEVADAYGHVVLWLNSRGSVLTQEYYYDSFKRAQFQFFFDADKRAMIYNNQGTPHPSPVDEIVLGPNIITYEIGKRGMTKKIAYLGGGPEGLTMNNMTEARMAAYAYAIADPATNTAQVTLWRAW